MTDSTPGFLKIVVVGEEGVGKTALLERLIKGTFNPEELPKVYDNYVHSLVDPSLSTQCNIDLWDTSAETEFDLIRPLSYHNATLFMVLFSIDDRDSLDKVTSRWLPEIQTSSATTPFYLVGTKADLRTMRSIQRDEGQKMAWCCQAANYFEVSARNDVDVDKLFLSAARQYGLPEKSLKSKTCNLV